jgi:hypothetical protein
MNYDTKNVHVLGTKLGTKLVVFRLIAGKTHLFFTITGSNEHTTVEARVWSEDRDGLTQSDPLARFTVWKS